MKKNVGLIFLMFCLASCQPSVASSFSSADSRKQENEIRYWAPEGQCFYASGVYQSDSKFENVFSFSLISSKEVHSIAGLSFWAPGTKEQVFPNAQIISYRQIRKSGSAYIYQIDVNLNSKMDESQYLGNQAQMTINGKDTITLPVVFIFGKLKYPDLSYQVSSVSYQYTVSDKTMTLDYSAAFSFEITNLFLIGADLECGQILSLEKYDDTSKSFITFGENNPVAVSSSDLHFRIKENIDNMQIPYASLVLLRFKDSFGNIYESPLDTAVNEKTHRNSWFSPLSFSSFINSDLFEYKASDFKTALQLNGLKSQE
jgi:hypothetical protein